MRVATLQTLLALGSLASAAQVLKRGSGVYGRQAFDPDESTHTGSGCSDFGPTYVECVPESADRNSLCIDPAAGETCCDNQWGCPVDSFCLVQDLCCPDGLDPETCAEQNNVDLPDDFGKSKPPTDEPTPDPTDSASPTEEPTEEPSGGPTDGPEPEEPEVPPTDDLPPQAGAGANKAGLLGAVVGLAAFAL